MFATAVYLMQVVHVQLEPIRIMPHASTLTFLFLFCQVLRATAWLLNCHTGLY